MSERGSADLSPQAQRMLSAWERRPALPTEKVEAAILAAGCPVFDAWLAFHERYAGYVEWFYRDWFILGLAHHETRWWTPDHVACERDGDDWFIWCAEGHPTYSYQLDQDGVFAAHGRHRSFDLYVERCAALREYAPNQRVARLLPPAEIDSAEFQARFAGEIRAFLVAELTDQFWRYYVTETYLVIEQAHHGNIHRAWERATPTASDTAAA